MLLLLARVLEELVYNSLAVDTVRQVVVRLVAQRAHDLGREDLVEHVDDFLAVGLIRIGDRALVHLLTSAASDLVEVCLEGVHARASLQETRLCKAAKGRKPNARK